MAGTARLGSIISARVTTDIVRTIETVWGARGTSKPRMRTFHVPEAIAPATRARSKTLGMDTLESRVTPLGSRDGEVDVIVELDCDRTGGWMGSILAS